MAELDQTTKVFILHQIIEGLNYLHHNGVMHRDIKPENILLTEENTPKIADFGTAKHSTVAAPICGTLQYIAPEVIKYYGTSKFCTVYTIKADVYSFGVMAFKVLTLGMPELGIIEYPSEIKQKVNAKILSILSRCLSKKPNMRPNFQELANTFDQVYATNENGKNLKSMEAQLALLSPSTPDEKQKRSKDIFLSCKPETGPQREKNIAGKRELKVPPPISARARPTPVVPSQVQGQTKNG